MDEREEGYGEQDEEDCRRQPTHVTFQIITQRLKPPNKRTTGLVEVLLGEEQWLLSQFWLGIFLFYFNYDS